MTEEEKLYLYLFLHHEYMLFFNKQTRLCEMRLSRQQHAASQFVYIQGQMRKNEIFF